MQSSSFDNFIRQFDFKVWNLFYPELQLINTKPIVKNKLKELLSGLKKFQVHLILALEYKKRIGHKILQLSAKPIANDLDIDVAFKSMY